MNLRFTFLLILLLVGTATWIFVFQPRLGSTQERARAHGLVLKFSPQSIDRIEIQREEEPLVFERRPRGWDMVGGARDVASAAKVEEILESASLLRALDRIPAGEFRGNLRSGAYGFNPPKLVLILQGRKVREELFFGREATAPDLLFVRRGGSDETFVVPDTLAKLLLEPTSRFRDPRLVNLPASLIDRFQFQWHGTTVEFERNRTGWDFIRPLKAPADPDLVEAALENFLGARVQEFVDPSDLKGLPNPEGNLLLWPEGREAPLSMALAEADQSLLVTHPERPGYLKINRDNLQALLNPLDGLRLRRLQLINPDLVDQFEIVRYDEGEGSPEGWHFRRVGLNWEVRRGEEKSERTAQQLQTFFTNLNQTPIAAFLSGTKAWSENQAQAAAPPSLSYRLTFSSHLSENTPEARAGTHPIATLVIGRPNAGSGLFPARREGSLESLELDPSVEKTLHDLLKP